MDGRCTPTVTNQDKGSGVACGQCTYTAANKERASGIAHGTCTPTGATGGLGGKLKGAAAHANTQAKGQTALQLFSALLQLQQAVQHSSL